MRTWFLLPALLLWSGAAQAQNGSQCTPAADVATITQDIAQHGMVARFIRPEGAGPFPALLILGGSEGGTRGVRAMAAPFAAQGYAVLALSYFRADGLPPALDQILLETFDRGLAWLAAQPSVDRNRIGIFGISKGAEAALLVASRRAGIRAVVAGSPSHVVWQGLSQDFARRSSWSAGGAPLPFLPYEASRGFVSIFKLYEDALPNLPQNAQAAIPVERINGPILLISGRADALWPSAAMAEAMVTRLRARGFRHRVAHVSYADAGHMAPAPPAIGPTRAEQLPMLGGTIEANDRARAQAWPVTICFFREALAPSRGRRPRAR
ncbi:MAG TPA: acyl-CoA thioester hydrolase/BAAT C-terminal domain-containing protein [Allosphingosinicella sp.]|nr:acyl-CoA thioester hydrolase/BAAT C-terminal domain-containing protein [Allosphingosinicella sp.]